jgi:C4-dicarboxylate transporter
MIIAAFDTKSTTLLKILGSIIIFFAAIHLLIGLINLSNQSFLINLIDKNFRGNTDYYFYFMPFLLLIGLSYLILGIRLPKLRTKILVSHIIISISLIIWTICWVLFNDQGQETITELNESAETMANSTSLIIVLIIILIPQIIIGNKLYRLEKGHNAT